ncbi:MAG TPA: 16S rRNA (adenine(1518)-N(6)/adenine(1519)-N(6))-dimethyltransferase, partial [Bacteroidia bacterium]|nr:16S rRNA (adenine(1518)-N(6)/adenine(1519)-N(6))-dimethyltransferase [Bacteroidia bacterium]
DCDEVLFKKVIKTAFNQRRKKLSNAMSSLLEGKKMKEEFAHKRAEQLSWQDFVELTNFISQP